LKRAAQVKTALAAGVWITVLSASFTLASRTAVAQPAAPVEVPPPNDVPPPSPPAETPPSPPPAETPAPPPADTVAPAPSRAAPYSLPFQLRTVHAVTAVRSDTSFGAYENTLAQGGVAVVSELSGSWLIPGTGQGVPNTGLAPTVKLTVVNDSPPGTATGGFAFVNPLIGTCYAFSLGGGFRANTFLLVTLPVGMGGGNTPDKGALDARTVGPGIRSGMDNPLFGVNDFSVIPGLDVAYIAHGLTLQAEVTFAQLERVRGAEAQLEASKTAMTAGAHFGFFLASYLSFGAEVRFQWWINPPFAVQTHKPNTSYDLTSLTIGPRLHFQLGPHMWIRPGVSFTRGLDPPMTPSSFNENVAQLDIPLVF
jgi:hypothetical protein